MDTPEIKVISMTPNGFKNAVLGSYYEPRAYSEPRANCRSDHNTVILKNRLWYQLKLPKTIRTEKIDWAGCATVEEFQEIFWGII